MIASSSSYLRN